MSKREAALKSLETLSNNDDTQSIASDNDDVDFLEEFDEVDADVDDDSKERKRKSFLKKKWTNQRVVDSIESTIKRRNPDRRPSQGLLKFGRLFPGRSDTQKLKDAEIQLKDSYSLRPTSKMVVYTGLQNLQLCVATVQTRVE
ncbi:hypothetical protein BpHYR1_051798 [Brachionus plicatilis]|uniref:Uncharacterized protein n=1 Tax=Brachionus plicatilis TaxID=10195 RepID=A0A3M7P947_BRAPC|nr:hypothetical protein BpHYR1_051798 [Brachionus plicatilis]